MQYHIDTPTVLGPCDDPPPPPPSIRPRRPTIKEKLCAEVFKHKEVHGEGHSNCGDFKLEKFDPVEQLRIAGRSQKSPFLLARGRPVLCLGDSLCRDPDRLTRETM